MPGEPAGHCEEKAIMKTQEIAVARGAPTGARRRARMLWLLSVLFVAIFAVGGWRMWNVARYHRALAEINAQMAAGRNGLAAQNLLSLLARQPDSDEAMYLLGVCERARGRRAEAARAWSRVPPNSPFWVVAIYRARELYVERGLLADAEQVIKVAQQNAPSDGLILNELFAPIYGFQGRIEESVELLEAEWEHLNRNGEGATERAINLLKLHIDIPRSMKDQAPTRDYLEKARRVAPGDDRVWLGRADLSITDGAFAEAAQLLDDCVKRRPDDFAVWRARLRYALATGSPKNFRQAIEHLPAEHAPQPQIHKLAAWVARQEGDHRTEERELERVVKADPTDLSAVARLAEFAEKASNPERARELRRRSDEIAALQIRYQRLYERNQPIRDAVEMAQLAMSLGLRFEAKALLTIAVAENPDRNDLRDELHRLSRPPAVGSAAERSLALAVDDELTYVRRTE
jgi:tetratricopeptide (TPR) repeat protein